MKFIFVLFIFVVFLFIGNRVYANFGAGYVIGMMGEDGLREEMRKLKKELDECRKNLGECQEKLSPR